MTQIQIKEIANWFFNEDVLVHIRYYNGHWCRGKIKEVNDFFLVLDELKAGKMLVPFDDIQSIEKFVPKEVKEDGGREG